VAYAPLAERVAELMGGSFRPGPPVDIAGIMCVRVGAGGFEPERVTALCQAAGGPVALYGHPHSLHGDDATQSLSTLRHTLTLAESWMRGGAIRCLRPRDLLCES
jgi:hypothetical protein